MAQTLVKKPQPNLATALRTSAQGINLGKQIFTQGVTGLNPLSTTQTLRSILNGIGYKIPQEVVIPLDITQAIMAGGVFVNSVETANDVKSICIPGASAIKAATLLLSDLGILSPQASQILTLGADATMAIASGGLDIFADIALLFDLIGDFNPEAFNATVKNTAISDYNNKVKAIITPQKVNAANIMTKFTSGSINIFEAMGEVAQAAPALFFNYFPDLQNYVPSFMQEIDVHKEETNWTGQFSAYDYRGFIKNVTQNKELVEDGIITKYLLEPMQPFYQENRLGAKNISVDALALLSVLSQNTKAPISKITPSWSAIPYLIQFRCTPFILGDEQLFEGLSSNTVPNKNNFPYENDFIKVPKILLQGGLTVNGVQQLTPQQKSDIATRDQIIEIEKQMQSMDQNGDIESLSKIPLARIMLSQWSKPASSIVISDYWQGLKISDQIRSAPYFKAGPVDLDQFNYLGNMDAFAKKYDYFHQFVVAKNLNLMALNNIARYLGTTADKIVLRQYSDTGLGIYKTA